MTRLKPVRPCSARRRACASASTSSSRSRAGAPSTARERLLDGLGDPEERQPPVEERRDGDLVRRVEGARVRAAALAGLAREREHRERLDVGRAELERQTAGEVERRDRGRGALGIGQRERDRHAHVRDSRGARAPRRRGSARARGRSSRVDDHLDPVVRRGRRGSAPRSARAPCSRAWRSRS